MLKEYGQTAMELSPYQELYDKIIPSGHILRRLKENIDFSFVKRILINREGLQRWVNLRSSLPLSDLSDTAA